MQDCESLVYDSLSTFDAYDDHVSALLPIFQVARCVSNAMLHTSVSWTFDSFCQANSDQRRHGWTR